LPTIALRAASCTLPASFLPCPVRSHSCAVLASPMRGAASRIADSAAGEAGPAPSAPGASDLRRLTVAIRRFRLRRSSPRSRPDLARRTLLDSLPAAQKTSEATKRPSMGDRLPVAPESRASPAHTVNVAVAAIAPTMPANRAPSASRRHPRQGAIRVKAPSASRRHLAVFAEAPPIETIKKGCSRRRPPGSLTPGSCARALGSRPLSPCVPARRGPCP